MFLILIQKFLKYKNKIQKNRQIDKFGVNRIYKIILNYRNDYSDIKYIKKIKKYGFVKIENYITSKKLLIIKI